MRNVPLVIIAVVIQFFFVAIGVAAGGNDTHAFSVHDMLAMQRVSDVQVSPNGDKVVFVLRTTDLDADRGRTDLWLVGTDGKGLMRLTTDPASDYNPRWSPCGKKIWFISTRSGSAQVWRINVDGGEAEQVTDLPLDVSNLVVSPKRGKIAFTMDVFPDKSCPDCTRKVLDAKKKSKASGVIYDKIFIRHWDTWMDGRRSHIFTLSHGEEKAVDLVDLMEGMDTDTPSKPFGGPEEITFTPDGKGIIFTASNAGREEPWSTNYDLFYVPVDGSEKPVSITGKNKAWDTTPLFSHDGKTLAYLAMSRARYESDKFDIVLKEWPDGKEKRITKNWDRSASSLCWSADDKTLFVTASNIGQKSLFAIDAATGSARTIVKEGNIGSPSTAKHKIIFGLDHLKSPVEIYSVLEDGSDLKQITSINKNKVAKARMGDYEQFAFKGWNNETVYCYVVKPADFDPNKKYPVAFLIHGGPQGSFSNHFHYRWNPQAYAGAGYAAVMVDFHGSTGYGQKFCDSIRGDWGGKPLVDLKKGLTAALKKYKWMDPNRVAALGASFGGFMINWIEGNWPDRFRCLVNHDGNLDELFAYYATEELWFPEWDHKGTPWTNPIGYQKHNPVNFVKNWKTPMLVIHGQRDYRVVLDQGVATFNALQRRGIPSKFLYFPDECHWVQKPHNSVLWHNTVIEWLDKWCK